MIKVAVIYGGMSTEHDVSMVSAQNVIENLNAGKYDIYKIENRRTQARFRDGKQYHTDQKRRPLSDRDRKLPEEAAVALRERGCARCGER